MMATGVAVVCIVLMVWVAVAEILSWDRGRDDQ